VTDFLCLVGLELSVPSASSIFTAYGGHHHLTSVLAKHRVYMNSSHVNVTQKNYLYFILL